MAGAFGIYLNANARRVSPEVVARIEELVHPDDIFYCSAASDARIYAARILERGYPTVFTGGGDGTVVGLINALHAATGGHAGPGFPALGVLSLGTGNALSRMVSSGSALQDLKSYITNPSSDVWSISLVRCEGYLFPFGSAGLDAEILCDYDGFKTAVADGPLKPLFRNVGGYFVAAFGATVPRHVKAMVQGRQTRLRVIAAGEAFGIGSEGEKEQAYAAGDLLYEGPAHATIAGTIPYYGYGLKLMPFADRHPEYMHLRVARLGIGEMVVSLPSIWKGTYRGDGFVDFYATRVRVEFSEPVPFQMAGDQFGLRDAVDFELVPRAVRLLRFI